jgi:23S rRNA pseudouridine2605 synthase
MTGTMRLQKFLAQAGVASRREAEKLIVDGQVRVNGSVVRELGTSVVAADRVTVKGKLAEPATHFTYLVLHKPIGVVTTMRDPQGRRTIADLVPSARARIVPVGRLDYNTSGVLLLTNDGDLANRLLHPRYGVEKTYRATVRGRLTRRDVERLRDGIRLPEFRTEPAKLRVVAVRSDHSVIDITIHEGRNRQVRRMLEALGHPVRALARLRFGPVALGSLAAARTRPLAPRELAALRALGTNQKVGPNAAR